MTDKVRKTVSFPEDLEIQIARRAQKSDRSFSAQVVADMRLVIKQAKFHSTIYDNKRNQGDSVEK
jgi:hypothetical protein